MRARKPCPLDHLRCAMFTETTPYNILKCNNMKLQKMRNIPTENPKQKMVNKANRRNKQSIKVVGSGRKNLQIRKTDEVLNNKV